jgi:hypothetical protein
MHLNNPNIKLPQVKILKLLCGSIKVGIYQKILIY